MDMNLIIGYLPMLFGALAFLILMFNSITIARGNEIVTLERRWFGKPMPDGRTVALKNEVGVQARILGPGFHFLIPFIYKVKKVKFLEIPAYKVGLVHAISGQKHWNYGKSPSQETRKKMSQSHQGIRHYLYGKHLSEETKLKLSIGRLGQKHWNYGKSLSQDTRKKMSNSLKGKKMSEETKEKISNSRKGMVFTEQHKEKIRNSLKKRY